MDTNLTHNKYFLLFRNYPTATSGKVTEAFKKAAYRTFEDFDRVVVEGRIEDYVDELGLILDGVNEQFPDEKGMQLNLTADIRGMRYITCSKGGFQWIVYKVKSKA